MPDRLTIDEVPRGDVPATGQGHAMATAGSAPSHPADSCLYAQAGNVFGTYLHGFFDRDGLRNAFVERLCRRKGIDPGDREVVNYEAFKEAQFAKLSAALRASLDMARIYEILEGEQV